MEEQKQNVFQQMKEQGQTIPEENINPHQEKNSVGMGFFEGEKYIKTPEVGESVEFTIKDIVSNNEIKGKNPETGETFNIGVQKKNGEVLRYDIITTEDEIFTINSWAIFYLLKEKDSKFLAHIKEKGTYKGVKIRLTRNFNGQVAKRKTAEVMKLYDFETMEAAKKYQETVAAAIKEGTLYSLDILN